MVLVIDDDPSVARLVAGLLRAGGESGATVRTALTLADGLAEALRKRPTAVFLDLKLPDAEDQIVVPTVRAALDRTPIIVLTADGDRDRAIAALREGADDFLVKSELTAGMVARVFRHAVERARYQSELARSERLAGEILEAMGSMIVVLDGEGRVVLTNRAWRSAAQGPLSPLCDVGIGERLVDRLASEPATAPLAESIRGAIAGRTEPEDCECALQLGGQQVRLRLRTAPSADEVGTIVIAIDDVTSQRRIEERLVVSDQHLALAIDAGRLGAWEWDLPAGKLRWNRRHEELWGFAPGGFDGSFESFRRRVHPDDLAALEAAIDRALRTDGIYRHDFRMIRPDGTVRWTEGYGRFFFDAEGRALRGAGVVRDATAERVAEAALLGSQRLAALGELSAGVAHDLGNLIALARSGVARVRRLVAERADADAAIDDLELLTEQGGQLVESLLGFSRPEDHRQESPQPIDLGATCVAFVGFLRRLLPRTLRLVVDAPDGVAWAALPTVQVQQVLMNLILNAHDALGGAGRIAVRVVEGCGGTQHAIEVTDDGPGIPRELLDRIFEPFVSSGHAEEGRGYGLGLAIVRSIAEEAGGSADVELPAAGGTILRVRLPAAPAPTRRASPRAAAPVVDGAIVAMVGPADYARSLVADGLRDAGLVVREFADADRLATELRAATLRPAVVLIAALAARERPEAAMATIRAAGSDAPVILIAAPGDEQAAPSDAILLRKPVTVGVVRDAVRSAVAERIASVRSREELP